MKTPKEKLHEYIESADDEKVKELLSIVENGIGKNYEFSDEDIAEFDKEWEGHLAGDGQSVSLEDFKMSTRTYLENKVKNAL